MRVRGQRGMREHNLRKLIRGPRVIRIGRAPDHAIQCHRDAEGIRRPGNAIRHSDATQPIDNAQRHIAKRQQFLRLEIARPLEFEIQTPRALARPQVGSKREVVFPFPTPAHAFVSHPVSGRIAELHACDFPDFV